nr:GNAT family N-acetyltransferase [Halalkalibacter urbisdiaboli]
MQIKKVDTAKQLEDAYEIRKLVFVEEQQVPEEEEIDQYEQEATHFVVYADNQVIGAGRVRYVNGFGKIERICLAKTARGKGIGQKLMNAIESEIIRNGYTMAKLNAQRQAEAFYTQLDYQTISEEFLDAGIPHVTMKKKLQ